MVFCLLFVWLFEEAHAYLYVYLFVCGCGCVDDDDGRDNVVVRIWMYSVDKFTPKHTHRRTHMRLLRLTMLVNRIPPTRR